MNRPTTLLAAACLAGLLGACQGVPAPVATGQVATGQVGQAGQAGRTMAAGLATPMPRRTIVVGQEATPPAAAIPEERVTPHAPAPTAPVTAIPRPPVATTSTSAVTPAPVTVVPAVVTPSPRPVATGPSRVITYGDPVTVARSAALQRAVRAWSDAYLGGNGPAAHPMLSTRCRAVASVGTLTRQAQAVRREVAGPLVIRTLQTQVTGRVGWATYLYDVPSVNQIVEPWILEGSAWKRDVC
ncbi:hypothetical protein [Arsenicicoccus dermatophilus]|uniref:hypothetical protein n=1 Tax=Arsenicicoccus dermatophilus TaxID=1076331 RepID=UPI001F4CE4D5|nr:hypothetical protein [Arsenicicoccus dermatophilus]MCH8614341.1 hypothetical protein [Arsenicicoccus dermatophilus]